MLCGWDASAPSLQVEYTRPSCLLLQEIRGAILRLFFGVLRLPLCFSFIPPFCNAKL
jgi:hypothetical protein